MLVPYAVYESLEAEMKEGRTAGFHKHVLSDQLSKDHKKRRRSESKISTPTRGGFMKTD